VDEDDVEEVEVGEQLTIYLFIIMNSFAKEMMRERLFFQSFSPHNFNKTRLDC
jgi:hypothetical protein